MPEDCSLAELRQLVPSYITEITAGHWYRRMRISRTVMKKGEECAHAQVTARTNSAQRRNASVRMLFATLRLRGGTGRDGCQSALWDCFGGRICRHVENRPTMHLTTIATRSPAQPQSGKCKPSCLKSLPQTQSCVWINNQDPMEMTGKLCSCYDFRRVRYLWNITGSYIVKRTIALPFELKPKTGAVL